jgi:hypothetical protein
MPLIFGYYAFEVAYLVFGLINIAIIGYLMYKYNYFEEKSSKEESK